MRSKWYELKDEAVKLRRQGLSLRDVELRLKIPRSTLSGWFKSVSLSNKNKKALLKRWKRGLVEARKKAVSWHNKEKTKRIDKSKKEAQVTLSKINSENHTIQELALSMLYLGEGNKKNFGLGSSDPRILCFFIKTICDLYHIEKNQIYCSLNLRFDQDGNKVIKFWSRVLGLKVGQFRNVSVDKRTEGVATYPGYKGVCQVRIGDVNLQRRLIFLAEQYCDNVINKGD